jgi:hypothetical protein
MLAGSEGFMFRTTVFPIATAATLGLLCASSSAQDRDDVQEVGENAPLCMAVDPIVGSDRRSYYQLVQKQFVWKVGDGLQPESKDKIKIGVFFIDGTDDQKRDVMYYMREWIESTEAPIEWVFGRKEHIKIRFNVPDNKSLYGNQAATEFLSDGISTMHLGVYNQANPSSRIRARKLGF